MSVNQKYMSVGLIFDTIEEANTYYDNVIQGLADSPNSYLAIKPVEETENGWLMGGDDAFLSDEEILEGNFSGHYSIYSRHLGFNQIGIDAEHLPYFMDMIEQETIKMFQAPMSIEIPVDPLQQQ